MRLFPARVTPTLPILPAKVNILIDQAGHARLADFGLLSIISDPKYLLSSSSHTQGGTARWMSPERINPERFGYKDGRPTISADCYALGMVAYEIVSGKPPFHKHADLTVITKVLEGERPPQGCRFTNSLWKMLEMCWAPQPNDRPSIEAVLRCLETVSNFPAPPFPRVDEGMDDNDNGWDSTSSSSGGNSIDSFATDDHGQPLSKSPLPAPAPSHPSCSMPDLLQPSEKFSNTRPISRGPVRSPIPSTGGDPTIMLPDHITSNGVPQLTQNYYDVSTPLTLERVSLLLHGGTIHPSWLVPIGPTFLQQNLPQTPTPPPVTLAASSV